LFRRIAPPSLRERMPNYGYHLARAEGHALRRLYSAALPLLVRQKIEPPRELAFDVFSYSSEADLPEQVASIRSFLKYAGRPRSFTVMSDGSHFARSTALLRSLDSSVTVGFATDCATTIWPESFRAYLRDHRTGKQLAVIMSLPANGPVFYIDSDVLFFRGASALVAELSHSDAPASYLADCQHSADDRLFRSAQERGQSVNTGVLFLRRKLDWSIAVNRFVGLDGAPNFFTNQTLTQLAMHANGAEPFDRGKFVLQLDDQFVYRDRYAAPHLVLRHYVQPVRHKFWTALLHHG
jgi:hypothetical protein